MIEFALGAPVLLTLLVYSIEVSNYALAQLRVSQLALGLADNASRVGASSLATQQLREVDLNDVLAASRLDGTRLNLTKYGRVTLSSLEADNDGVQRIHWQRCLGTKTGAAFASHYGTTSTSAGSREGSAYAGTVVTGMGPPDGQVTAPKNSGVMFVEINYQYQPVFGASWLLGPQMVHYTASFIVRDRRDFSRIWNLDPQVAEGAKLYCDRFTA